MSATSSAGIILRAELRAYRHRLLKRGTGRLVALAAALLVGGFVIGGGAFSLGVAVGHFLAVARDPIIAGGFTTLSVLMLVVGFPTVIATFYVGRDLLQLILAPVRPRDIFAARAVLAMSANLLISAILLAAVLGVGVGAAAPLPYYGLAIVLVLNQVLVVTAFQALVMSIILRWIPARLARDVAAAVAGLTGAGFYLAWNLNLRQSFTSRRGPDLTNLTNLVHHVDWIPSAWPGHALSAAADGNFGGAFTWSALAIGLGVVLVLAAELLYARTLLAGLGVFGSVPAPWRRAPRRAIRVVRAGAGSPLRAMARKDWLGYRRDIRRLSRLLPALLSPIGYAFAFLRPGRGAVGFWSEALVVAFVSMFMATALGTPSIPGERRGFQLLRMAPIRTSQVMRAKIAITLPPVVALTVVFSVVVSAVTGSAAQAPVLVAMSLWLGLGFVAISVSSGAIDPRFDSPDDRRAVGLLGTLCGIGGSVGFGLLSLGAVALWQFAPDVFAGRASLGFIPSTQAVGASIVVIGLLLAVGAAAVVSVLLWVANLRLGSFDGAIEGAS